MGTPPAGLTFDTPTRTLSGTPTAAQSATTYTWRVTDTDGDTAEQEFTITVLGDQSPQLTAVDDVTYIAGSPITPLVLPEGTGGNAPLTHLLVGTPPAGLTFDTPTRTLSGTPTAAQSATTYTWRVTDTDGDTAEQEFTITVLADQSPQLTAVDDVTYIAGSAITPLVLPEGTGGNAPLTHLLVGDAAGGTDVRHADADAVGDADGGAGGDDVHVAGDGHGRGHGGAGVHDHGAGGPEPAADGSGTT